MEEERIPEVERLQMEQIRELEMEELQIEEVEDNHYSSPDDSDVLGHGGGVAYGGFTFDTCLASLHTYLGEVEDTHHRVAFLDGRSILNLPMFYLEGVVLFPEATLPLRVIQPRFIAAIERALNQVDAPYTIGVVHIHRSPDDEMLKFATIGTTAEDPGLLLWNQGYYPGPGTIWAAFPGIRQYRRLEDGSLNVVTRGQQRFHLRRRWVDVEGAPCAEIQIIQEDSPLRTPRDAFGQLASVSNLWSRGISRPLFPDASHVKQRGNSNENNDSESMSDTSSESSISLTEMRMHRSTVDSCNAYDRIDELTSSDDDEFVCESEPQFGRSNLADSGGSSQRHHEERSKSDGVGQGTRNQSVLKEWRKDCAAGQSNWLHRAPRSYWPHWVYQMYDSYSLARRVADMWKQIIGVPSMDDLVKKPDLLSFHIASKIPVSESTRQELLEIDGISYRLRREIELLESFDRVRCKNCQTVIAKRSDMVVMSSDGPLGAFANQHGYVHEVMTLSEANGLALNGSPVKEYSWFPGYAWTITSCATCESQMGWLFTAINKKLKPRSFWGIRSSQVADDMR
ncbi:hypothetical protein HHK36_006220 [Tetracentron sinense]|uniref:Protein cereblon n=1 Tax=Tetracentron sinense TaxID=13715 RepID=A0A834ZKG7_TETSI|nr:hypothetical protein HHK36_006220 [Tetracentron sinense]